MSVPVKSPATIDGVLTLLPSSGVVGFSDKAGQIYNVKAYGVSGDGSTNDASAIQAVIDAANAAGGGTVFLPQATYAITATVVLKRDVILKLAPGATVKWTGSSGGTMFAGPGSVPLVRSGVTGPGGRIDPNSLATYCFDLQSPQYCRFEGLEVEAGATTTVFRLRADATAAESGVSYENGTVALYNRFAQVSCRSAVGTVVALQGANATSPVTLNTFTDFYASDVRVVAVSLVQWCDNNVFDGIQRYNLNAANAQGVVFNNSGTPASDVGVYGNQFQQLAIDTFAGLTGRKALVYNKTKTNTVRHFHQDPVAEGGAIVVNGADSYYIERTGTPSDPTIYRYQLLSTVFGDETRIGFIGVGSTPACPIDVTVATTDPAAGIRLSPTITYSASARAVVTCQATVIPSATLTSLYGLLFIPTIGSSAANANAVNNVFGIFARIDGGTGYTGTVATSYAVYVGNGVKNNAGATFTTGYGLFIEPITTPTNGVGARIDAANLATLWLSGNADNTGATAGIAFGASRDTNLYRSAASTLKTDGSLVVGGVLSGAIKGGRLTADATRNNTTTFSDLTNLGFAIGANEVWTVEWHLAVTTSGTSAGTKFQVTGPASPTDLNINSFGLTSGTAVSFSNATAFSSATVAFGTTAVTGGTVRISASVNNGANAGTVQLQAAGNATTNSTNSVLRGSYMVARRIA